MPALRSLNRAFALKGRTAIATFTSFVRLVHRAGFASLMTLSALAGAAPALSTPAPDPGRYITRGAWAGLDLDAKGHFTLESISGRAMQQCHLEGRIVGHRATLDEGCVVAFDRTPDGLRVRDASPKQGACLAFCGANASFEAEYFKPQPACSDTALGRERARATADFQARRFEAAEARLKRVLTACGRFVTGDREYGLLNDLALTQHRAGRSADCLATLRPVMPDLVEDPEAALASINRQENEQEYRYLCTQVQIRFNWRLCGGR